MSAVQHGALPRDPARLQALHGRMVEALLDGGGLHAVARLAARAAGGRVVIDLPHDGLAAATPGDPAEPVALRVPITTGDDLIGSVALHRRPGASPAPATGEDAPGSERGDATADALHAAAMATLTYVALLREERPRHDPATRAVEAVLDGLPDAATRLRAAGGEAAGLLVARLPAQGTGRVLAALADDAPRAPRAVRDGWVLVVTPPGTDAPALAQALGDRLGVVAGAAPLRPPANPARALGEARLGAQLVAQGDATPAALATGTWRLLVRDALRDPVEVAELAAHTLGPLLDDPGEQLPTFQAYLANDCNMNATAAALPAHRHTVAYRLDRVRDLTGLDPATAEDREQLGVALKARAVTRARRTLDGHGAGI
jgi:hypothetical protein